MKKLFITLLTLSLSCFAGQLSINPTSGTPTVINFNDIAGMEVEQNNMVLVQQGKGVYYQMGAVNIAEPVHFVNLNSFYIGKYEVTQAEWVTTMGTNPSTHVGDNFPVEMVSWYDIMVYCNTRSIAESLTPCYTISSSTDPVVWGAVPTGSNNATWDAAICNWSANGYRLPTEAEWEFAARGGNSSNGYTYSGSNTIGDVAWYSSNSNSTTHAVGTKAPNELGIYDMSGNVWELNWDCLGNYSSSAQTDPHGEITGWFRIIRGGSYTEYLNCRVALRGSNYAYSRYYRIGFRLARTY